MSREPEKHCCLPSQTVGPFFHFGLTADSARGRLWAAEAKGERIRLQFRMLDGDAAMRALVAHRRHDRALRIAPLESADPRGAPQHRVSPVRGDEQARADSPAVR